MGEWRSKLFTLTADKFCFRMDITSPERFKVVAYLFTTDVRNATRMTETPVFLSEYSGYTRVKLIAQRLIGANSSRSAQLVSDVSAGVLLNEVGVQTSACQQG